jgi:hypothetical protein
MLCSIGVAALVGAAHPAAARPQLAADPVNGTEFVMAAASKDDREAARSGKPQRVRAGCDVFIGCAARRPRGTKPPAE